MAKFVWDANIVIALKKLKILESTLKFFQEENHHIVMAKENMMECGSSLSKLRNFNNFKEINYIDKENVQKLKKECKNLIKGVLHSNKDRDYYFIECAKNVKADYLVTNDRGILRFFTIYKNRNKDKPTLKNIQLLPFAGMLLYMYNIRHDIFDNMMFTECNLNTFELIELKNYFKIMNHHIFEPHEITNQRAVWEQHLLDVYKPYSSNVMRIFENEINT